MKNFKICVCLTAEFFLFIGFLIIFIINFLIYSKFNNIDSQYTLILSRNWLNSPIVDIQILSKSNCSYNNTSVAIFDNWPGTVPGCPCNGIMKIGGCTSKTSCRSVVSNPMLPYNTWRSSQFCITRLPINSYLGLTIAKKNDSCPLNQKNCGIIDTLGNILCMPSTSICPINDIQMLNFNEIVPPGYKSISLLSYGENKTLAFGNKGPSGKIAVEFKISDNIPCINPFFSNKVDSYILESNYNSDKCFGSLGGTFFDKNYQFVDSTTKYNLYSDNNIIYVLINLPYYPTYKLQNKTRLYYRNYIGINKTCLDSIQAKNLNQKISDGLNFIHSKFNTFNNIFRGIFVYTIVIWSITLLMFHLGRGILCYAENYNLYDWSMCWCEVFIFICFLVIMILNIIFYTQMKSLKDAFDDFFPFISCGDNSFNEAVPSFITNLDYIFGLSFINFIVSIIIFILPLTGLFTQYCEWESDDDVEKYDINNIDIPRLESNKIHVINLENNIPDSNNFNSGYDRYKNNNLNNETPLNDNNKEMFAKVNSLRDAPPIVINEEISDKLSQENNEFKSLDQNNEKKNMNDNISQNNNNNKLIIEPKNINLNPVYNIPNDGGFTNNINQNNNNNNPIYNIPNDGGFTNNINQNNNNNNPAYNIPNDGGFNSYNFPVNEQKNYPSNEQNQNYK